MMPFGGRGTRDKLLRVGRISVGGDLGTALAEKVLVIIGKHRGTLEESELIQSAGSSG